MRAVEAQSRAAVYYTSPQRLIGVATMGTWNDRLALYINTHLD